MKKLGKLCFVVEKQNFSSLLRPRQELGTEREFPSFPNSSLGMRKLGKLCFVAEKQSFPSLLRPKLLAWDEEKNLVGQTIKN